MIDEKFKKYAIDVQEGKIVTCKYIKQATKRYLDWFDRDDLVFRPEKVDKVVNFISHLKHFTGQHNGKNFILLPYQYWIISNVFGFYYKGTDRRVINYMYCELARKQGKTALVAAICLYMLVADGENGSEVEVVANNSKQAKICFQLASNFLQSVDPKGKHFQRYRDSIKFDKTKSFLQVLSSDSSGNDGFNSYCFVLDEAHEQKDSRLWDVLVSSQGMRTNSLGIIITTAGFNKFGFCYAYRKTCLEILSGVKQDDTQFAAIYTLDEDDDWSNPDVWIKANPSLGVTVLPEYLTTQVNKAKNNTSLEVGTRTKNFNQWVSSSDVWITNDILLNSTQKLDLDFFKEKIVYCGVDLAAVSDLTALSICTHLDGKFYFKTWYFLPESALQDNSNCEMYKLWKQKGELIVTPGNVTDYDYVQAKLMEINDTCYLQKIAYDSYNATQFSISCTEAGLPMFPFSQALWHFNRCTKEFERLAKSESIVIDDNEITRYCFSNVVLKFDFNENCKPIKGEVQNKIDGVIAMLQSLGTLIEEPQYNNQIFSV